MTATNVSGALRIEVVRLAIKNLQTIQNIPKWLHYLRHFNSRSLAGLLN